MELTLSELQDMASRQQQQIENQQQMLVAKVSKFSSHVVSHCMEIKLYMANLNLIFLSMVAEERIYLFHAGIA